MQLAARREERKEQEARQEAREAARRKKQKARQEGRADNPTGFVGVYLNQPGRAKPIQAQVRRDGRKVSLGPWAASPPPRRRRCASRDRRRGRRRPQCRRHQ